MSYVAEHVQYFLRTIGSGMFWQWVFCGIYGVICLFCFSLGSLSNHIQNPWGKAVEKDLWMVSFPSSCLKLQEGNKMWIILKMWWFPDRTTPTGQTHRVCWCENHLWWCPPKKSKQFYIKVRRWSFSSWNLSGSYTCMISDRRQCPQTWRFDTGAVVLSYIAHHTPRMRGMFPCNWFGSGLRANLGCCMSMCVA